MHQNRPDLGRNYAVEISDRDHSLEDTDSDIVPGLVVRVISATVARYY